MSKSLAALAVATFALGASPLVSRADDKAPDTATATAAIAPGDLAAFDDLLKIGEVIGILHDEGLAYGKTLDSHMLSDQGGARWEASVEHVYDVTRMRQIFDTAFAAQLQDQPTVIAAARTFLASALGQRILALETEARRTLMDDAAEDAARLRYQEMEAADAPRLRQIRRFAEVNDLVETNVVGALNSNLAFLRGMAAAGAFGTDMTEDDMLSEVRGQEAGVRHETEDWLFPYLTLAYSSLSDDELASYIAFSESAEGKMLNIAMFAAFDKVFTAVSFDLGRAAAVQMRGQDI